MSINGDVSGSENKSSESFNFSSADIAKREKIEYFTNVKGAEKHKRQTERKEKRADRKRQRVFKKDATKSESARKKNERAEEVKRLKETKRTRREYRLEKLQKSIWRKRKIIAAGAIAVVLAVAAIIVTPIIINAIDQANKERIIAEGETDMVFVYRAVAGKEFAKEELEKVVKNISPNANIEYYELGGQITDEAGYAYIGFQVVDDMVCVFEYYDYIAEKKAQISEDLDEYIVVINGETSSYDNVESAVEKFILEKANAKKD